MTDAPKLTGRTAGRHHRRRSLGPVEVEAAASEAREICTRLGAPVFLQRLDEAVGRPVR